MAIVFGNMITCGLRGKVGNMFVFRSVGGKTVVSRAPGKQDKARETAAQRNTRTTFRQATLWAKNIIRDPEKKSYYKKLANKWKLTNAYTAAIKEYMRNTHAKTEDHSRPSTQQPVVESRSRRTLVTWKPFDIMVRNSSLGVDRFNIERSAPRDLPDRCREGEQMIKAYNTLQVRHKDIDLFRANDQAIAINRPLSTMYQNKNPKPLIKQLGTNFN